MNFEEDVKKKSYAVPIVVDFWAPWCGPCKVLGPVLENMAEKNDGKWELIKVNTEEFPTIAEEFQIRSIPNVKMFIDGEVIDEFVGSMTQVQIQNWLDKNIPNVLIQTLSEVLALPELEKLTKLEELVAEWPDFIEAKVELSNIKALQNPKEALAILGVVRPSQPEYDTFIQAKQLNTFLDFESDSSVSINQYLVSAKDSYLNGNIDSSLEILIKSLLVDNSYKDQLARKTILAIFYFLGKDHDLTKKYRKLFEMYLY